MIDLKKKYFDELTAIFSAYCPKAEIWAYGSRIKNQSHSGSDLDLTVKAFNEEGKSIVELRKILNDSDIPFLIEIQEFNRLPKVFQDEIVKKYVQIFPMSDRAAQLTFYP